MSNPLQCVASYAQSAVHYFGNSCKEESMSAYDLRMVIDSGTCMLNNLKEMITSNHFKKDKALTDAAKVFAKALIKHTRSVAHEQLSEFETEF